MLTNPIISPFPTAQASPVAKLVRGSVGIGISSDSGVVQDLVRLSLVAARPAFELDFNNAQNQALARLDDKIQELQSTNFGSGKTALLRVKAARLERELVELRDYKERVSTNRLSVTDILASLSELRALADSSTATEFDAKRTEVLDSLDRLLTAVRSRFGAPDGLRSAKSDGTDAISSIVTNNFATPTDVQNAQDTIDKLSATLSTASTILESNQDGASKLISSAERGIGDAKKRIDKIVSAERRARIDEIEGERDKVAQLLTSISLAFETNQAFGSFIAQSTVLKPGNDPGSVLNLFA